jgi:hypothetical protein
LLDPRVAPDGGAAAPAKSVALCTETDGKVGDLDENLVANLCNRFGGENSRISVVIVCRGERLLYIDGCS